MKASLPLLLFALAIPLSAQEGEEFNPLGRDVPLEAMEKQLRIEVEWFETDSETYEELINDDDAMRVDGRLSSDAGPFRDSLMTLVRKNDAQLLETAVVVARSGQRAKVESIAEVIYPTEYDPGGKIISPEDSDVTLVTSLPTPTAFETRNVGVTLEVDPVLGADERVVDLNLAPELVYKLEDLSYGEYESKDGEVDLTMPVFYTVKATTQTTLIVGEYGILAVQSPFDEKTLRREGSRKVILMVKAELVHVGLGLPEDEPESE